MRIVRTAFGAVTVGIGALLAAGCGALDPQRPTPQPDTTVYGNLLEVGDPAEGGARTVRLQVGVPRALARAKHEEGRPAPIVEKGVTAEVTVGPDAVVLRGGLPASLDAFDAGAEVVIEPVPGTTRMIGPSRILLDAGVLVDFPTWARWKLPELPGMDAADEPGDPARVNSAAVDHAPVPLAGGRVLYFSSRLRRPPMPDGAWLGARRDGLRDGAEDGQANERTYRCELGPDGWSAPELVLLPGLEDAEVVRVSWVSADETECLVTVGRSTSAPWLGRSTRPRAAASWGAPAPVIEPLEAGVWDGVYLAGSRTKVVMVGRQGDAPTTDLMLLDPKQGPAPLLLDPRINTIADERDPRVGPQGELFFGRGERQLVLVGESVRELRLAGPHRAFLGEAAPTDDGRWVFFVMPRLMPAEPDLDLWVAPWDGGGELGQPVAVDDWRP